MLCCEAFKILKADFTELLLSYLGMKMYSDTLEKLGCLNFFPLNCVTMLFFGLLFVS